MSGFNDQTEINWTIWIDFEIQLVSGSDANSLHTKKQKKSDKRIFLNADAVSAASSTDPQGTSIPGFIPFRNRYFFFITGQLIYTFKRGV